MDGRTKSTTGSRTRSFLPALQTDFDKVKSELIETHYNWYVAVEPDSGDYFVDKDLNRVWQKCGDKHPGKIRFGEQEYDIPVHVGEPVAVDGFPGISKLANPKGKDLEEVLLGRQWLQNMRLIVDISSDLLTLGN